MNMVLKYILKFYYYILRGYEFMAYGELYNNGCFEEEEYIKHINEAKTRYMERIKKLEEKTNG